MRKLGFQTMETKWPCHHRQGRRQVKDKKDRRNIVLVNIRRAIQMLSRPICTPIRPLLRIPLQRTGLKPQRIQRNYGTSKKSSHQSYTDPVPTPANLRSLRSKEHMLRKAIIRGFLAATVVAYYLDGKYNARAIRRTLRTAWVGATLAADYKWNFTFNLLIVCVNDRPEKAESIEELHKRVARRIMELISANGGLYIKLGVQFPLSKVDCRTSIGDASCCTTSCIW